MAVASKPIRIAITSGDQDGIGTEITAKALASTKPRRGVQFFLWRSNKIAKSHLRLIDTKYRRLLVTSWPEALSAAATLGDSSKTLIDINSPLPAAQWVEISARAAVSGHLDGIATAPISKTAIIEAGLKDIGHTDILRRTAGAKHVHMAFVGSHFNVLLATGHLALRDVPQALSPESLTEAIASADQLRQVLPRGRVNKPIAVVGLNPHASEKGLIGDEEVAIIGPVIQACSRRYQVIGPLVPDAAFLKSEWGKYSCYVTCYHDQGLIPFKMIHGKSSGVHLSMGLPFVRTSVDHGTAKDLFGKNKANASSMIEAIAWAVRLCQEKINQSGAKK